MRHINYMVSSPASYAEIPISILSPEAGYPGILIGCPQSLEENAATWL
jgi:hypothetical protein